jgi:hypothetical protein
MPKPVWHYPWHYGFAKKSKSCAKESICLKFIGQSLPKVQRAIFQYVWHFNGGDEMGMKY